MTQRDMAGYLGIDRTTLYNWKKNKPNLYKTVLLGLKADEIIQKAQQNADEIKELKERFELRK